MTATNHALTGAIIGLTISEPLLAMPLAFLSHFVCDAIPHFDSRVPTEKWLASDNFKRLLIVDTIGCVIFVGILALVRPRHWLTVAICAFLATSPDLFQINHFAHLRMHKPWKPNLFSKFTHTIQWKTGPLGALVEAEWFLFAASIVTILVRSKS